ncbi:MAG: peptidylprolyl isomerase [Bacteroidia bacterium]|nr:peptidylprolyl isomerase [Bacteroidia bacterium]
MKRILYLFIGLVLTLASCSEDDGPTDTNNNNGGNGGNTEPKDTLIELKTDHGTMILYMYKGTPIHRANFHKLVADSFYNGTEFHRIIPGFMIQGGDPNSKDNDRTNDGRGGPGYTLPAEIDTSKYKHDLGAVAAARQSDQVNPERRSSGSQFYIVVSEQGTAHLNNAYTVFGKVIQGQSSADDIVSQPRNSGNLPNARIPMTMSFIEKTPKEILDEYGFEVE